MDKINPDHYKAGKAEVIDITETLDFCLGNVVKYVVRAGRKAGESRLDDLLKASYYLSRAVDNEIRGTDG